jgi:hypothetical protein
VIEQAAEFTFGSWSALQVPLAIEYPLEVLDEIRAAATEGLQKFARGGLEIAGVLHGTRRENSIRIVTWRPIPCQHALGPTLQLSEHDRAELTRLLDTAATDPDVRGLQPVGWFVSHTRSDVVLSAPDLEVFNGFFPELWQVTLVLRPTQAGPARAGFFVREADGALKCDSSYQEFDVKPLLRGSRIADSPIVARKELSTAAPKPEASTPLPAAAPLEGRRPARLDTPLFPMLERSRARHWLWLLPVVLALTVAGFLLKEKYLLPANQPFSLRVYDAGETVQVEWDQNAVSVQKAHLGVIDIKDAGETKRYPLADDELHSGKMSYLRRGGDLELRMTVYPVGLPAVQEYAHFLDPGPVVPPPAPAVPSEVEQLRKERDRLQTEVQQLKRDLRKERSARRRAR